MTDKELELFEYVFSLAIGEAYSEEINEIANLQRKIICTLKENQELKKQLDELQTLYNNMFKCHCNRVQVETLLSQQKEFIEYLESEMILFQEYMKEIECSDRCHGDYPITYWSSKYKLNEVAEILSKYKETIGGLDE